MPNYIADYYAIKRWGESSPCRIAGWRTPDEQSRRFATLLGIVGAPMDWTTLLDVGCGQGCLFSEITTGGYPIEYTGIDILPEMIDDCHRRFPTDCHRFSVHNIFDGLDKDYDHIIGSGVFSINNGQNLDDLDTAIEIIAQHATRGFAVNFLALDDADTSGVFARYDETEVVDIISEYCENIEVIHDEVLGDFAVLGRRKVMPAWHGIIRR